VRGAGWALLALGLGGCMQQAVLENDVRSAVWKSRTLSTAADLSIAHAALSSQLVELEALYQRDPNDRRVSTLLVAGYQLMGRGFVELRRLEAVAAGDAARAEQEARLRADAEARASYYGSRAQPAIARPSLGIEEPLAAAAAACGRHDLAGYERQLNQLLSEPERSPEQRLERTLRNRLASAWLMPKVAARCGF
jgi:hypothetical protein